MSSWFLVSVVYFVSIFSIFFWCFFSGQVCQDIVDFEPDLVSQFLSTLVRFPENAAMQAYGFSVFSNIGKFPWSSTSTIVVLKHKGILAFYTISQH